MFGLAFRLPAIRDTAQLFYDENDCSVRRSLFSTTMTPVCIVLPFVYESETFPDREKQWLGYIRQLGSCPTMKIMKFFRPFQAARQFDLSGTRIVAGGLILAIPAKRNDVSAVKS